MAKTSRTKKAAAFDKAAAADRVKKILPILKKIYPQASVALRFGNPLELLIATILSAQCTDARVNMVTPDLFRKYRSADDWAGADLKQIEQDIRTCGFYHNKAKSLKALDVLAAGRLVPPEQLGLEHRQRPRIVARQKLQPRRLPAPLPRAP